METKMLHYKELFQAAADTTAEFENFKTMVIGKIDETDEKHDLILRNLENTIAKVAYYINELATI